MTEQDVTALFDKWNAALFSGNAKKVTSLYASNAVLLPTMSNQLRHNHLTIEAYFKLFLIKVPSVKLVEKNIQIFVDIAINSGVYDITFKDDKPIRARFSYVYQRINNQWKIISHHSSQMPE